MNSPNSSFKSIASECNNDDRVLDEANVIYVDDDEFYGNPKFFDKWLEHAMDNPKLLNSSEPILKPRFEGHDWLIETVRLSDIVTDFPDDERDDVKCAHYYDKYSKSHFYLIPRNKQPPILIDKTLNEDYGETVITVSHYASNSSIFDNPEWYTVLFGGLLKLTGRSLLLSHEKKRVIFNHVDNVLGDVNPFSTGVNRHAKLIHFSG